MKVGVMGSGNVGQVLAAGFASKGHTVKLGTREPASPKLREWQEKAGPRASAGTFAEAAEFADLAVLATLWDGTENALQLAGADRLAGKVLIDATNPLHFAPNAPPTLAVGHTESAGELVQRWLPKSRVVKAFNTIGNAHMIDPKFPGGPPDMFLCGNDAGAKKDVSDICRAFGLNPIDLGGLEIARYLEPLAMIWILYGFKTNTWDHAFKLLYK